MHGSDGSRLAVAVLACAVALAGCQHAPAATDAVGRSAFTFVAPPAGPAKRAEPAAAPPRAPVLRVPARPVGTLAVPVYPPRALAARAGVATVGVQITIGRDGRVSDVGPSLAAFSTPGPWAAEFRAAVEVALAEWRFYPAEVRHMETVSDPGGDYLHLKSREIVETVADVAFTFSATGEVVPAGR